jgi:hypothetical protein
MSDIDFLKDIGFLCQRLGELLIPMDCIDGITSLFITLKDSSN